jgi:hypothetical protein
MALPLEPEELHLTRRTHGTCTIFLRRSCTRLSLLTGFGDTAAVTAICRFLALTRLA